MGDERKALVRQERQVNTYAQLGHAASVLLQSAQEVPKGSFYKEMASLVMSAFALEAYLNHLGTDLIESWNKLEYQGWKKKLKALLRHLELTVDWNARPFSTLTSLFKFRDTIAHGRSAKLIPDPWVTSIDDDSFPRPKTEWEQQINGEHCRLAHNDVSDVITRLSKAAGLGDYPMGDFGFSSTSAHLIYDDQQTVHLSSGGTVSVPREREDPD